MKDLSREKKERFYVAYEKYSPLLYRVAFGITRDVFAAEDVVQEVFISYLDRLFFNDERHEAAWLVRVAVNKSKNIIRKNRRIRPLEEAMNLYHIDGEEADVLKEVLLLPENYRIPILLHYFEGYSLEEISSMLSLSLSAVKMRMKRGREYLKLSLGEES